MAFVKVIQRSCGTFRVDFVFHKEKGGTKTITFRQEDARKEGIPFTRLKVKAWAERRISDMERQREAEQRGSKQTLRAWLQRWIDEIAPTLEIDARTVARYCENLEWHVMPHPIGDKRLDELSGLDVQTHLAALRVSGNRRTGAGLSARTCIHVQQALRRALKAAVTSKLIPANFASSEHVERGKPDARKAVAVVELPDLARLLRRLDGHRLEPLFALAIFMGLRRGEVCAVGLDQIDFQRGTLRVSRAVSAYRRADVRHLRVKAPKTESGDRVLPLPRQLLDALRRYIAERQAYWTALGLPWPEVDGPGGRYAPLFHTEDGALLDPDNVSKEFTRQCRRAGIPAATMHTMRHTWVSQLLARKDLTLKAVSSMAGHANTQVTQLVYWHITEAARDEGAEAVLAHADAISAALAHPAVDAAEILRLSGI